VRTQDVPLEEATVEPDSEGCGSLVDRGWWSLQKGRLAKHSAEEKGLRYCGV
jgi:hypothetical protein